MVAEKAANIIRLPFGYGIQVEQPRKEIDGPFLLEQAPVLINETTDPVEEGSILGRLLIWRMSSLKKLSTADVKMGRQKVFTMYQQDGDNYQITGEYWIDMDDKNGEVVRMLNELEIFKRLRQDRKYSRIIEYASSLTTLK